MRFEYYVLLSQLALFPLAALIYGFRASIISLVLCLYGPAASLVKFSIGPAIFPLGSIVALIGIIALIFISPINKNLFAYVLLVFLGSLLVSLLGSGISGLISALHFLLYTIFGLLLGHYLSKFDVNRRNNFIKAFIFYASMSFVILMVVRFIGVNITNSLIDMRDVGFGMLPMLVIFIILLQGPSLKTLTKSAIPFIYLLSSLTRSYLLDLVFVVIYSRKRLIKGVFFKPIFFSILILGVSFIFLSRASSSSNPTINNNQEQYEELAQVLTLTTRLNGLLTEWDDFTKSPIYGNGIAYYETAFSEFKAQGLDTISDDEYIAYNHIGVISVLAQGGIILFILTLIIPCYIIFTKRKIIFKSNDPLLFACMCLFLGFFILFFVSGSPVKKDYSDGILYYFVIGYIYCFPHRNHKMTKKIS